MGWRNQNMLTKGTIYQHINFKAERQQYPQPQLLTPDDDHFSQNLWRKLLKCLAFINF
jgi:hypothetical protein